MLSAVDFFARDLLIELSKISILRWAILSRLTYSIRCEANRLRCGVWFRRIDRRQMSGQHQITVTPLRSFPSLKRKCWSASQQRFNRNESGFHFRQLRLNSINCCCSVCRATGLFHCDWLALLARWISCHSWVFAVATACTKAILACNSIKKWFRHRWLSFMWEIVTVACNEKPKMT